MITTSTKTMRAVAIDRFGDVGTLQVQTLPVPEVGPEQILIRVESAGVGPWDAAEREGVFAKMFGMEPRFPHVLGFEGAGTIEAVGEKVDRFRENDLVYGFATARSEKGFYAQYTVVRADDACPIPRGLTTDTAGALTIDGGTALRGLRDTLHLKANETIMIFGAGGGIGHMAVQLAKRMGARVFAVASGDDGVALARRLGADATVEGHQGDVLAAARKFAPDGLDAALLSAGGPVADQALQALRAGGRAAYPNGVQPIPKAPSGLDLENYNGAYDRELLESLNKLIEAGPFEVHIARTFTLEHIVEAHRALQTHYLGRLALRVS
ncbi:MAG: NADP-dependent oxidoreductase [Acidobacteriota bacterium]